MDFIDKEDGPRFLVELGEHAFQAFLEIASILGPREQGAEVQGVDGALRQHLRYFPVHDHLRQPLRNGGLAHTRLANKQRVVLPAPAENLDSALDFHAAPDERVDLAEQRLLVEIDGIGL